eukprot:gene40009-52828_t
MPSSKKPAPSLAKSVATKPAAEKPLKAGQSPATKTGAAASKSAAATKVKTVPTKSTSLDDPKKAAAPAAKKVGRPPKAAGAATTGAKRGRKPLDPALPREVVRHELPEDQRVCPHDGAALREIGVETSEQLDVILQQVRVIRHERVKYACPCCDGGMRLAARPAQIIPRGLFTESALAWMATAKYLDGLPLYRQAVLLGRFGGTDIARNTVAASMVRAGLAVQPVVNLLRDFLLDSPLVFGDETELQVLKEPGRSAQAKSYIWAQMTDGSGQDGTGPPIRLFAYSPSRSTKTAMGLYAGIRPGAVLMTDGYDVYDAVAQAHERAWQRFEGLLQELVDELPGLRAPVGCGGASHVGGVRSLPRRLHHVDGGGGGGGGGNSPGGGFQPDMKSAGIGAGLIAAVAVLIWLGTGFFIVQEGQQAVITRFGELKGTRDAGFNW